VSVVIPTYYREERLERAIESALDQTYGAVEVVVVDDSGEAFAEETARQYDITYIPHERNRGGNPARNTGIEAASGEYVQLLDDDDRLLPSKVEKQVAVLEGDDETGACYCGLRFENGNELLPEPDGRGDYLPTILANESYPCYTVSLLIDAATLERICPLASRPTADDIGFMIELARRTRFDFVDEVLVEKGEPENQRSQDLRNPREHLKILEEYDHLYRQYDPEVRRRALTHISDNYFNTGLHVLSERRWSPTAIRFFWLANRYRPELKPGFVAILVASLFGAPGARLAVRLGRR
jgi:glycosyltransferase involved in cell wall biosynthesis